MLSGTVIGRIEIDPWGPRTADWQSDDGTLWQVLARLAGRMAAPTGVGCRLNRRTTLAVVEADLDHLARDLHRETCNLERVIAQRRCGR